MPPPGAEEEPLEAAVRRKQLADGLVAMLGDAVLPPKILLDYVALYRGETLSPVSILIPLYYITRCWVTQ